MRAHRFSLIEILVVISIIVILAGMILGVTPFVHKTIRISKTKAQIAQLRLVMEMYHEDWGFYPQQSTAGSISSSFFKSLKKSDNGKPFYKEEEFNFDTSGAPVDGFSQPFFYDSTGVKNTTTYDLWSMGPDGLHGGNPVTSTAGTNAPSAATDPSAGDANDDIANWKKLN